ncbi:MAG: MBL fold metallo-hydrolase [Acidobacteriota bacterium]|nr:MAG: MBL fold metallo-hydrolase [Acidobacteriota bacterium]
MTTPLDAASLILISRDRRDVLWAQRNPAISFLGGYHSFSGGKLEPDDSRCDVRNEHDAEMRGLKACAVRETFEEIGVLLVRNGEKLTKGQFPLLHDDLVSGREPFSKILEHWGLWIDGRDLEYAGCWTTPEFSPVRFKTRFFISTVPEKQEPYAAIGELRNIEFVEPSAAVRRWSSSEVLVAPPVLFSVRALNEFANPSISVAKSSQKLRAHSARMDGKIHHIELNSRLSCIPLRTKTLPPATHTNCFIVGSRRFVVIDPASREVSEQEKLFGLVDDLVGKGGVCDAIIVSHLHRDHFGGESVLKAYLRSRHEMEVPVVAHPLTVESLKGETEFHGTVGEGDTYKLKDSEGLPFGLEVLHTPGHARGHLSFFDPEFGFLLTMDNVLSHGSVLIDPPEGNMEDYLASLRRMRELEGLRSLCGSHGTAVSDAKAKIDEYIEHRLERERQVAKALESGARSAEEIAGRIYTDLDPGLMPLAVRSVAAHLERLEQTSSDRSAAG